MRATSRRTATTLLVALTTLAAACGGSQPASSSAVQSSDVAPTEVAPTTVPATEVPATAVPPTALPATEVPSTPTAAPTPPPTEAATPATAPTAAAVSADDIPVAYTPDGGYGETMPPPILAGCTELLSDGAIDIRGMWQIVGPEDPDDADVPIGSVQRIEQCGNRMVITSGGVVHDMRVDGTLDNGVNDVAARDFTTPVRVAAFFEDDTHVLRPEGLPIEVTRHREGDQLIWRFVNFSARLDRLGPPDMEPPGPSS